MRKLRSLATTLAVLLAASNSSVCADNNQAWLDLMARMWRAFSAMTGQSTLPHSSLPDIDSSDMFGQSPYFSEKTWARHPWQSRFAAVPPTWSPPTYPRVSPTRLLDGVWQTHSGAILVVRAGRGRLYVDENRSQDFDLRLDDQTVVLRDRHYGSRRRYAYATEHNRLVMQDGDGNLLLLRRLPAARGFGG